MGLFKLGTRCCNNCIHWECHSERKIQGNPPKEVYTTSNCDKCSKTHRSTLSKDCCAMFCHIGGVSVTFPLGQEQESKEITGISEDAPIINFDPGMAFLNSVMDDIAERRKKNSAIIAKNDGDGDALKWDAADEEFARWGENQQKANDRVKELMEAGLDKCCIFKSKAIEFMHLFDQASNGSGAEQYRFACAFLNGEHGAEKSEWRAKEWFENAAEHGDFNSEHRLGKMAKDDSNLKDAIMWFSRAIEHGCLRAVADLDEAKRLAIGDATESIIIGLRNFLGVDSKRNIDEGVASIRNASRQVADGVLFEDVEPELIAKVIECLTRFANSHGPKIQDLLGMLYAHYPKYKNLLKENEAEAVKWFRKAAEGGYGAGMNHLGYCYASGEGVDKDLHEAVRWYKAAAEAGNVGGITHYASCLLYGDGIDKNEANAVKWYLKAAAKNDEGALLKLVELAKNGIGMREDPELAFEWCSIAAKEGNADAMHELGTFYQTGYGTEVNDEFAKQWQDEAVKHGYSTGWSW